MTFFYHGHLFHPWMQTWCCRNHLYNLWSLGRSRTRLSSTSFIFTFFDNPLMNCLINKVVFALSVTVGSAFRRICSNPHLKQLELPQVTTFAIEIVWSSFSYSPLAPSLYVFLSSLKWRRNDLLLVLSGMLAISWFFCQLSSCLSQHKHQTLRATPQYFHFRTFQVELSKSLCPDLVLLSHLCNQNCSSTTNTNTELVSTT